MLACFSFWYDLFSVVPLLNAGEFFFLFKTNTQLTHWIYPIYYYDDDNDDVDYHYYHAIHSLSFSISSCVCVCASQKANCLLCYTMFFPPTLSIQPVESKLPFSHHGYNNKFFSLKSICVVRALGVLLVRYDSTLPLYRYSSLCIRLSILYLLSFIQKKKSLYFFALVFATTTYNPVWMVIGLDFILPIFSNHWKNKTTTTAKTKRERIEFLVGKNFQ